MASGSPYEEFVKAGSSTIKRSYAKGMFGVALSAALAVLGVGVGVTWLREYPGEWYRFAPFVITVLFGYSVVTTVLEMAGGDVVLSSEGVQIGAKPVVRWSDIE